ncbi:hypothetical protein V8F33_009144 [Rhypophila sp. PSN 637]
MTWLSRRGVGGGVNINTEGQHKLTRIYEMIIFPITWFAKGLRLNTVVEFRVGGLIRMTTAHTAPQQQPRPQLCMRIEHAWLDLEQADMRMNTFRRLPGPRSFLSQGVIPPASARTQPVSNRVVTVFVQMQLVLRELSAHRVLLSHQTGYERRVGHGRSALLLNKRRCGIALIQAGSERRYTQRLSASNCPHLGVQPVNNRACWTGCL